MGWDFLNQSHGFYVQNMCCLFCSECTALNFFSLMATRISWCWLLPGSALPAIWQGGMQPASLILKYFQDWRLWMTENKPDVRLNISLHETSFLPGPQHSAASTWWWGASGAEGVKVEAQRHLKCLHTAFWCFLHVKGMPGDAHIIFVLNLNACCG